MKDSGIEWLGAIPDHWQTITISQLADITKTPNDGMKETNLLSLSYGKIKRRDIDAAEGLLPASFEGYNIIEPNDIVLRFTDLQNDQKSLRVGRVTEKGIITSAYTTIRPSNADDSEYLYYCLHSYDLRKGFYGMGAGVRQGLKWQEAKYIEIPWPAFEERNKITSALNKLCEKIDLAIEAAERSIEEYKDYKQSVILEAVTKGLDPDAHMKESGIEWLGEIPATWQIIRGKDLFAQRSTRGNDSLVQLAATQAHGMIPQDRLEGVVKTSTDEKLKEFKTVHINDFVISLRSFQGGFEISEYEGVCTPAYTVFYSTKNICHGYYKYLFKSYGFIQAMAAETTGIRDGKNISFDSFSNTFIPNPSHEEQTQIFEYLDTMLSQIDESITNKTSIIEDLKDYKKSLIYEAVTGKREIDAC